MVVLGHYQRNPYGSFVLLKNGIEKKYLKVLKMILGGYRFVMIKINSL
jgi:hypothetical protein